MQVRSCVARIYLDCPFGCTAGAEHKIHGTQLIKHHVIREGTGLPTSRYFRPAQSSHNRGNTRGTTGPSTTGGANRSQQVTSQRFRGAPANSTPVGPPPTTTNRRTCRSCSSYRTETPPLQTASVHALCQMLQAKTQTKTLLNRDSKVTRT